jgi:hypothetical protein
VHHHKIPCSLMMKLPIVPDLEPIPIRCYLFRVSMVRLSLGFVCCGLVWGLYVAVYFGVCMLRFSLGFVCGFGARSCQLLPCSHSWPHQKRPTIEAKKTYYRGKRDLPCSHSSAITLFTFMASSAITLFTFMASSKETYYRGKRDLL